MNTERYPYRIPADRDRCLAIAPENRARFDSYQAGLFYIATADIGDPVQWQNRADYSKVELGAVTGFALDSEERRVLIVENTNDRLAYVVTAHDLKLATQLLWFLFPGDEVEVFEDGRWHRTTVKRLDHRTSPRIEVEHSRRKWHLGPAQIRLPERVGV